MTHKELAHIGYRWLKNRSYGLVLCEFVSMSAEIPDVIGFKYHYSTLIECKISRSDFFADQKKRFRQDPADGMGNYRYYMTPKGLLRPDELPEGWGLLEVSDKLKTREVVKAAPQNKSYRSEHNLLYSIARRIEIRGLLHHALAGQSLTAHEQVTTP